MGRKAKKRQTVTNVSTLVEVLQGVGVHQWDLAIIGDGSGCSWLHGLGWASVLIDRSSGARKLCYGSANTGTVTIAEILPWLYPLLWYTSDQSPNEQRLRRARESGKLLQVHVLSDNTTVVRSGNVPMSQKSHPILWGVLASLKSLGLEVVFHSIPRDSIGLHILADAASKEARLSLGVVEKAAVARLLKVFPGIPTDLSVYDLNP